MSSSSEWIESLDAVAAEMSFAGVISVQRPDEPLVERAYGLADRRCQVLNSTDTIFAVASGTKAFTALTVMSLVLDDTLTLDTTARSVLGTDLPLISDEVTVYHLLAHRSGIGDYLDEDELDDVDDYVLPFPVHSYVDAEDYLSTLDGHPTVFPAGERCVYNNGGYVLLAILAQRAAGVAYHQLVHDRVIGPAGLADSTFQRSDETQPRTAIGYVQDDGLRTNVLHLPARGVGDGGLFTTVADLRTFWSALLAGRILPTETVAEMIRPHSDLPEEKARYDLGFWLHATEDQVRLVGSDPGISFFSAVRPAVAEVLTVVSNTSEGAWPLARHLQGVS